MEPKTSLGVRCLDSQKERKDESPTGVIEACMSDLGTKSCYLDLKSPSHWRKWITLWTKRSLKRLLSLPSLAVPKISSRSISGIGNVYRNPVISANTGSYNYESGWKNFTFIDLRTATNNFTSENIIGKGGYSEVYKGRLRDGQLIAVKRFTRGTVEEKTSNFLSELGIIVHVKHPNIAKLVGFGTEEGMHLVFELSALGCLGSLLHVSKEKLDWSIRYKIALGVADGLLYLHQNCQRRTIHRDIKADNILLTEDFVPQICDFGLAMWLPEQCTHLTVTKFEGTVGYFAPEYFMSGTVNEKTDVFSFGVLLLELITGRRALNDLKQSVLLWAKPLLDRNDIGRLVDPSLGGVYDPKQMDRMLLTVSLCVERHPILRPRMSQIVVLLRGDEYSSGIAKECQNPLH